MSTELALLIALALVHYRLGQLLGAMGRPKPQGVSLSGGDHILAWCAVPAHKGGAVANEVRRWQ